MSDGADAGLPTVRFAVTLEDLVAFHFQRFRGSSASQRTARSGQIAVGVTGAVVLVLGAVAGRPSPAFYLFLVLSIVLSVALYPRLFDRSARQRILALLGREDLSTWIGDNALVLGDAGARLRRPGGEIVMPWSRVRIEEGRAHVFLYADPAEAAVIPLAAFGGHEARERFLSAARDRMVAAGGAGA